MTSEQQYGHAETRERLAILEERARAHGAALLVHVKRMEGVDARMSAQDERMNGIAMKHANLDGVVKTHGRILAELGKIPTVIGELRHQSAMVQSAIKYGAAVVLTLLTVSGRVSGEDAGRWFGWFFGQ